MKKKTFTNKAQSDMFAFDLIMSGKFVVHGRDERGNWWVKFNYAEKTET